MPFQRSPTIFAFYVEQHKISQIKVVSQKWVTKRFLIAARLQRIALSENLSADTNLSLLGSNKGVGLNKNVHTCFYLEK